MKLRLDYESDTGLAVRVEIGQRLTGKVRILRLQMSVRRVFYV